MIKHPAFRVPSVSLIKPEILDELLADLSTIAENSPLAGLITDYEVAGSYARGCAELHSDFDINLATPSPQANLIIRAGLRANADVTGDALGDITDLWRKWGLILDVSLQHWTVRSTAKMGFSLVTRELFGAENRRFDILKDGSIRFRNITQQRPPRLAVRIFDEELGDFRDFDPTTDDPWNAELDYWRDLYGANFLEFGSTVETEHMGD